MMMQHNTKIGVHVQDLVSPFKFLVLIALFYVNGTTAYIPAVTVLSRFSNVA